MEADKLAVRRGAAACMEALEVAKAAGRHPPTDACISISTRAFRV